MNLPRLAPVATPCRMIAATERQLAARVGALRRAGRMEEADQLFQSLAAVRRQIARPFADQPITKE